MNEQRRVPEYSHGRHIASDTIRGFMSGLRGVLEARKMRREANTAKEQRIADEAYRQRQADYQDRLLELQTDRSALEKEKFEEQTRLQGVIEQQKADALEAQQAKDEALQALQAEWDADLAEWTNARIALSSLSADADPAERQRLTRQLHTLGQWLESNAERAGRTFKGYSGWTDKDDEAKAKREETDELDAEKQKKIAYIDAHPQWDDDTKERLKAQVEITPEAAISELVKSVEAEQQLTDTEAKTEEKRLTEVETAKQHAEKYKDEIIKNTSAARYEDLLYQITNAEKPLEVDVEPYLTSEDEKTRTESVITRDARAFETELQRQGHSEERIKELMVDWLEKQAHGALTEGEAALQSVTRNPHESVKDLVPYIVAVGLKGTPSTRKTPLQWRAISQFVQSGDREMTLDGLGDIYDALDRTKEAETRFEAAHIMQTIRDKILNLETQYGLEPSRTLAAITERMTEQSFASWWQGGGVDFFAGMNLTDEQITAAVELQTYINNNLVSFIKQVSGTAVAEQEFERLIRIMPGLFKNTAANMGVIDGNINLLRDQQFHYYASHSSDEVASEIMAVQGWGDVKTSTENSKFTDEEIDEMWNEYRDGEGDGEGGEN